MLVNVSNIELGCRNKSHKASCLPHTGCIPKSVSSGEPPLRAAWKSPPLVFSPAPLFRLSCCCASSRSRDGTGSPVLCRLTDGAPAKQWLLYFADARSTVTLGRLLAPLSLFCILLCQITRVQSFPRTPQTVGMLIHVDFQVGVQ